VHWPALLEQSKRLRMMVSRRQDSQGIFGKLVYSPSKFSRNTLAITTNDYYLRICEPDHLSIIAHKLNNVPCNDQ